MSNDNDNVMYSIAYRQKFYELGIQELWVKFGIKDGCRNILIHKLGQQLGGEKCLALLKSYILNGCDVTSNVGTKVSAVAPKPESNLKPAGFVPKSIS